VLYIPNEKFGQNQRTISDLPEQRKTQQMKFKFEAANPPKRKKIGPFARN
jgi:hypothetical protein